MTSEKPGADEKFGAAVLAGGSAERLGLNKALVEIAGCSVIDRILDSLKDIFSSILIVVQGESELRGLRRAGTRIVSDLLPGKGPLGGIYTALECSPEPYIFIMACDMPYPCGKLILHMLSKSRGMDAVVPRRGEYVEPLFAVYSRDALENIKRRLGKGDLKIYDLLQELDVLYVDEEEISRFDPEYQSFLNINTPEDLAKAARLAAGRE